MQTTEPTLRKVILKSDPRKDSLDPRRFHIVDAESGKDINGIQSLTLEVAAGKIPRLTVKKFPVDFDVDDIPFDATFEPTTGYVDDAKKHRWINGRWLAELFRKYGIKCMKGGKPCIALDVTEDLLEEWEGIEIGPKGGRTKENTSHGKEN